MSNRLQKETSPYLLQHKDNPVEWYPWGEEAFRRARDEDKPVFLSIGYSTCHWCHVMAHESFEDPGIADLLNRHFIAIKVDKEERPDVDSIYMTVCQAFTGSGGWPTSIFMTAEQKPFFAGTYFPKDNRMGMPGLRQLLTAIHHMWENERELLLEQADQITLQLGVNTVEDHAADSGLTEEAAAHFQRIFDRKYGGFGRAPKFPTPHTLLFLMDHYLRSGSAVCLEMAEKTLLQMYRGGLFDHIGFGFCRYSTDKQFLVPHFEKMLYDNALLILAYCKAHACTGKALYLDIAEKTADYILREMTAPEGGFYSAQDADSEGEEGKYYLFTPEEIIGVLGREDGEAFNRRFGITEAGNFEGKNIPNLLEQEPEDKAFEQFFPRLREYRRERYALHLDDKILTAWNGLMIAAMCALYRACGKDCYLAAAQKADCFLREHLCREDTLFVSFREGKRGVQGFLDDYAAVIFAQLALYDATLAEPYLERAGELCGKVLELFRDESGGFFLYGKDSEALILRPKETYDGAIPSGNSLMAYNLVRLYQLTGEERCRQEVQRQLDFLASDATRYPPGYAMYLVALQDYYQPPMKVTVVSADRAERPCGLPHDAVVRLLSGPTEEYPLKNGKTTYYVCKGHSCLPPVNDLKEVL